MFIFPWVSLLSLCLCVCFCVYVFVFICTLHIASHEIAAFYCILLIIRIKIINIFGVILFKCVVIVGVRYDSCRLFGNYENCLRTHMKMRIGKKLHNRCVNAQWVFFFLFFSFSSSSSLATLMTQWEGLEWEMLWISKSGTAFFPAAVCRLTKDFLLLPPLKTNMNFETCIPWSFSPRKSISDWRAFTMYQIHEYFLHFAYKWHTIEWMLVWKSVFSTGNRFGSFQRVFTRNCVCAVNFYWYENIIYLKNACVCEASLTFCPRRTLILS